MDGNGRWGTSRGLPRLAGHRAGVRAVRRVVEAAPRLGVGTLTLFAFTSNNWQRPRGEVAGLMRLFHGYFCAEKQRWVTHGIRVSVMGRRDRLSPALRAAMGAAAAATARGRAMHLRIALDYSARDAILRAARRLNGTKTLSREVFSRLLAEACHAGSLAPDVDLLIRTGGEQRLSDCVLWESAYAELFFTPRMWPDFDAPDLEAAIAEFCSRERRFGRLPQAATR